MKFIPWLVYEHFILFTHGWTRLIRISWTLWFELLRIRRWTHISPWYVLDAPPGNPGGLLLLSSSFWHLVEMLSQSISFFYSMPTKSLTMPYHLNKGKQKRKTSEQLNQLFPGQRRPRKSRFNYNPIRTELTAYGSTTSLGPASALPFCRSYLILRLCLKDEDLPREKARGEEVNCILALVLIDPFKGSFPL